ncbi:hypothetical protein [Streptomyces cinereoruber]|uniref:hypothetical protein n=1 Tax=Streptomyces cinereoruber TaxID=67260 RepID=UPI00362D4262
MTGTQDSPDNGPDTPPDCPDRRGGIIRTPPDIGETIDCGPLPTSTDTVRTRLSARPDGVRVEYTASVPRHLLGVAIADAFATIDAARRPDPTDEEEPPE